MFRAGKGKSTSWTASTCSLWYPLVDGIKSHLSQHLRAALPTAFQQLPLSGQGAIPIHQGPSDSQNRQSAAEVLYQPRNAASFAKRGVGTPGARDERAAAS